jgi:hypothetical protein
MKMEQCLKTSPYKIEMQGNYQKKAQNIQNRAKFWNQECITNVTFLWSLKFRVLVLNFMTEDGRKRFFRNIGNYTLICKALQYKSLQ